jgi:hypothetical protein
MTLDRTPAAGLSPEIDEPCRSQRRREPWRGGLAALAARQVLREIGEHATDAEIALERALESRLDGARKTLAPPPAPDTADDQVEQDGMHERDARAVAFLRDLGLPGSELRTAAERAAGQWAESASAAWLAFRKQAAPAGPPRSEPDAWMHWRIREGRLSVRRQRSGREAARGTRRTFAGRRSLAVTAP